METISQKDRNIIRILAKQKRDLHHSEKNQRNLNDWLRHNSLTCERPMIHLEISFRHEMIPKRLRCEGTSARQIEERLWEGIINHGVLGDDYPVSDNFWVEWNTRHIPFGMDVEFIHANNSMGYRVDYPIKDLDADYDKFGQSVYQIDKAASMAYADIAADIFGDILPVKIGISAFKVCPTRFFVHVMGMEMLLFSMYDSPEKFHDLMRRFAEDTIGYFRFLEANDAVNSTAGTEYLGQGSWCFTNELPKVGPVTSREMWGFLDSQESVSISPAMFEEMIFPYYKMIADQYGLLSYGCCEPVHQFWGSLSRLTNLRKITVSPWCDEEFMGEALKGTKTIYHRKTSPNFLGIGQNLDEPALREHVRRTLKAAKGCTLEITQRDVYTINNDEGKARRFVEIIREEIASKWI